MSVLPLGNARALFHRRVVDSTSARTEITEVTDPDQSKVLTWNGYRLNTQTWVLSKQRADATARWGLKEVAYVLSGENADVGLVVMIFRLLTYTLQGAEARVAVPVLKDTFLSKFAGVANTLGVEHATVPSSMKNTHVVPGRAPFPEFPKVEVGFDIVVHGTRMGTDIATAHIWTRHAGPRTMYFGFQRDPTAYTDLTYGGKAVWTPETLAAAELSLEIRPAGSSLKTHLKEEPATLVIEVELRRKPGAVCFEAGGVSLCPATGKLSYRYTNSTKNYDLAEVLYLHLDGDWVCVLHFSAGENALPFALRLDRADAEMLMSVSSMNVPTSTEIVPVAPPPWPNAHAQGALPVTRSLSEAQKRSLMHETRARVIYVPASGSAPATVVRYEPVPTCAEYRADPRWAMFSLCAADAAARAQSPACAAFKLCAPSEPGAPTASLIDARDPKAKDQVPLYDSKETGVLYGLTERAVYVVRPAGDSAEVAVATETGAERFVATKEGAAGAYRIVAADPPCAELVTCVKSNPIEGCALHAEACAQRADRSPIVARLAYNGAAVELRALDADVLFGIDRRGAFALHVKTGSALFAPKGSSPLVLTATLDAGTYTVGEKQDSRLGLWIGIGVAIALAILFVVALSLTKKRG